MTSNLERIGPRGLARRRAWRPLRGLALAAALVVLTVGAAPRPRGYLPRVGPTPLRAQLPPPPMILTLLPPLKMSDPVEETAPKTDPKKTDHAAAPASSVKKTASASAPAPAGSGTNSAAIAPPNPDSSFETLDGKPFFDNAGQPVIQSQRLVKFFQSPGTNGGSDVHLAVPDGFTPPGAAPRPSSSATYISK